MAAGSNPPNSTIRSTLDCISAGDTRNGRFVAPGRRYSGIVSSNPCCSVPACPPFGSAVRIAAAAAFGSFSAASTDAVAARMNRRTRSGFSCSSEVRVIRPELTRSIP